VNDAAPRTAIANATVAADYGVLNAHLLIEGRNIAAVVDATDAIPTADELIDASGCVVLPGAIDTHTHFEDPGHTEREDFTTGTMAAAAGGITTVFEHPLTYPAVTTTELYVSKREMASQKAVIDFGLWGALTGSSLPHMEGQWREGAIGFQETVPATLSEAYHRRGMALDAFARFSSTNAAKILGVYPRKGTILPGSQADLVVWDLDDEWVVDASAQQFSKNPWSPYDGRRLRTRVLRTIIAGQTVFADGQILVKPGHGQFVSRAKPGTFSDARRVSTYHHTAVREPFSSAWRTGQTTGAGRGG
jgi:dihydroorotase-like cyclic amidohydrolase